MTASPTAAAYLAVVLAAGPAASAGVPGGAGAAAGPGRAPAPRWSPPDSAPSRRPGERAAADRVAGGPDGDSLSAPSGGPAGWKLLVGGGAAVAGLLPLDPPVRDAAHDLQGDAADGVFDVAERFGRWEQALPAVAAGALGIGGLTGGARGVKEGVAVLAGLGAASAVNETVNRAVGRRRPSWEEGSLSLDPFRGHASFPSGHTAFAFGVAGGVDAVTESTPAAAAAYGLAGLTGISRVYHDQHWLTDVVAGAAVGSLVSRWAAGRVRRALLAPEGSGAAEGARVGGGAGRTGRGGGPTARLRVLPGALYLSVSP